MKLKLDSGVAKASQGQMGKALRCYREGVTVLA